MLAEKGDFGEFVFDLYITGAGPYWGEPFRMAAEQEFELLALTDKSEAARGWTMASVMVRTGLYLCERRDPGLYHDFLTALATAVLQEADIIDAGHGRSRFCRWFQSDEVIPPDNPFMALAEGILAERIVDEPRAVAYALFREGLQFCEDFAPERYPGFVLAVADLLLSEARRAESGPRRILPRAAQPVRRKLRVLPAYFNMCAAGTPAEA